MGTSRTHNAIIILDHKYFFNSPLGHAGRYSHIVLLHQSHTPNRTHNSSQP